MTWLLIGIAIGIILAPYVVWLLRLGLAFLLLLITSPLWLGSQEIRKGFREGFREGREARAKDKEESGK